MTDETGEQPAGHLDTLSQMRCDAVPSFMFDQPRSRAREVFKSVRLSVQPRSRKLVGDRNGRNAEFRQKILAEIRQKLFLFYFGLSVLMQKQLL